MHARQAKDTIKEHEAHDKEWTAFMRKMHEFAFKVFIHRTPTDWRGNPITWGSRKFSNDSVSNVTVENDEITVHQEYYSCGEDNYEDITFPVKYLDMFEDEWRAAETDAIEQRQLANRIALDKKAADAEIAAKEARHQQYLKLKKEFE